MRLLVDTIPLLSIFSRFRMRRMFWSFYCVISIILAVFCHSFSNFFFVFLTSSFSFVTHCSSSRFLRLKVRGEILF